MRRQLSEERKRLHKNTHNWSRIRYRKMLLAHVNQKGVYRVSAKLPR